MTATKHGMGTKILAVVTLLVALLAGAATASATGRLLVRTDDGPRPLETAYVHVAVDIDERLARTTVTQVFVNHTDGELEGTYVFPLPRDAAVAGFALWDAGTRIAAELREKDAAREDYLRSAREGGAPALVEETPDGAFEMNVFGIPAGGTKRVELVYTELLDYSAGIVSYVFPAHFRKETAGEGGLFDVDITVRAPDELAFVGSPSWPEMTLRRPSAKEARLSLSVEHLEATRDVDVAFGVATTPFGLSVRAHRPGGDEPGVVQLGFAFNRDDAPERRPAREVLFAIDTSLSMAGAPLQRARQVVRDALELLPAGDRVNIVAFDSLLQSFVERSVPVTADNVAMAGRFVDGLRAQRGSDLGALLASLPELFGKETAERVLVLLTDGQPTVGELDDAKLKDALAARDALDLDVMVVHLGYPSRRAVLEHLAPGATYHYIPAAMDAAGSPAGDAAAEELVQQLAASAMKNVTVTIEGAPTLDVHPSEPRTLFSGRQLLVHARYLPPPFGAPARVVVEGELHGERRRFTYDVSLPARTDDRHAGVVREWAKEEVRVALRAIDTAEDDKARGALVDRVRSLGRAHALVTPYTSFLVRRPASLSLERFKPGDPEIYIEAPASMAKVVAILPWGETIPCRWLADQGRWMGRFLVPRGTVDGVYRIRVILVSQAGDRKEIAVFYRVDGTSPKMRLETPEAARPGELLRIRAVPVSHVFEGDAGTPRATLRTDVRRAVLHVAGRSVKLRQTADGEAWEAAVRLPHDLAPGDLVATLVVTDWAANSFRTERTITIRTRLAWEER